MTAICQKKNKGMRAWLRKNAVGYAFLMPFLVLFAIFVIVRHEFQHQSQNC